MADSKLTALTADTSPTSDDVAYVVDAPGGTPVSKKVTLANIIQKAHGLGNGIIKIAAGVMGVATAGTDYYAPGSTDVAVADGGTGASTAASARTNLGLGTVSVLDSDTDTTLAANSDLKIATQKAVKAYVDTNVTGLLDFKGATDASANPNYPGALKGDTYVITVAGKVGGASGKSVDIGDVYLATADNAGGTEASVGTSWSVLEHNLVGALIASNNLSDLTSASTARTNLGLGTLATQSGTFSGTSSGTNTGDQTITLTGDVTGSGTGSFAATIAANAVTLAKMAQVATATFLGRTTAATGNVEALTTTQATALLNSVVGDSGSGGTKGLVPAPGAGDAAAGKYLSAGGTFTVPAGSGGSPGGSTTQIQYNNAGAFAGSANNVWDQTNKVQTTTGQSLNIADLSTTKPLVAKGAASQSATLIEAQDSSGNVKNAIRPDGSSIVASVAGSPSAAPTFDGAQIFVDQQAGLGELWQQGRYGITSPVGREAFYTNLTLIVPNASSLASYGTQIATQGTATRITTNIATRGVQINYASAASAAANAGVSCNFAHYARGSSANQFVGFVYDAFLDVPDASYNNTGASTGSRIFSGMSSSTSPTTQLGSDSPATSYAAFVRRNVNGGATDTNWRFQTKDGTTLTDVDSTIAFTIGKIYRTMVYCPPGGSTIYGQIWNLTDGTTSGVLTSTTNLPATSTAMCPMTCLQTVDAVARNLVINRIMASNGL